MLGRTHAAVKGSAGLAICEAAAGAGIAVAALLGELAAGAPEWVQLLPLGEIRAVDGRAWRNADPAAVVKATLAAGRDLPIDYDHATDFGKASGAPAPAAGWIKKVELRADGIWGRVEWTERAKAALSAREWRFISPVFNFDKSTLVVQRILRAGLTNDPAIAELAAVATIQRNGETMTPELRATLAKILGLPETASEQDIATAAAKAKSIAQTETAIASAAATAAAAIIAPVAKALGLAETAKPDELVAAATTLAAAAKNPDPAKFAPIAVVAELQGRVGALEQGNAEAKATAAVEKAMKDGKLTPAMKEWGLALAKSDMKAFEDFVGKAPTIVAGGRAVEGAPGDAGPLTPEEKAVCRNLGLSEEAYLKTKKEEAAARAAA